MGKLVLGECTRNVTNIPDAVFPMSDILGYAAAQHSNTAVPLVLMRVA